MKDYAERLRKIDSALLEALENDPCELAYPLAAPVKNLMLAGGKRWRPLLSVLCAELAAGAGEKTPAAYKLAPLTEFAHTASLVHDDIEDSSDTRRGLPAAHIAWGIDTALNAASWLYFKAAECIDSAPLPDAAKIGLYSLYMLSMRRLHAGQAMDIAWHKDKRYFPSKDEYMKMSRLKTGTLASLAVRTGLIAGAGGKPTVRPDAVAEVAEKLGTAFQILDDATNLSSGNPGKKRGDDVVEGKKSYIVVTHLEARPHDADAIAECFERAGREGIGSDSVERLIALVTEAGTLASASRTARSMISSACGEFARLFPDRPEQTALVTRLFTRMAGTEMVPLDRAENME
jgi:octaprenyl-diphosphate synthase